MYGILFYLTELESAGISTPGMKAAGAHIAVQVMPDEFRTRTDALAQELAVDLAEGRVKDGDEFARRLAGLLARQSALVDTVERMAQEHRETQARAMIAEDSAEIDKRIRAQVATAQAAWSGANAALRRDGVRLPIEAMAGGREVTAAWGVRDEASVRLGRLSALRDDLTGGGILRPGAAGLVGAVKSTARRLAAGVS